MVAPAPPGAGPRCGASCHWHNDGKIEIAPLIIHPMPLDNINTAFDLMRAGDSIPQRDHVLGRPADRLKSNRRRSLNNLRSPGPRRIKSGLRLFPVFPDGVRNVLCVAIQETALIHYAKTALYNLN